MDIFEQQEAAIKSLSVATFNEAQLAKLKIIYIDTREQEEYNEGHISGAWDIPPRPGDLAAVHRFVFWEKRGSYKFVESRSGAGACGLHAGVVVRLSSRIHPKGQEYWMPSGNL
jgi:rhodanese-related sulfurtransferase